MLHHVAIFRVFTGNENLWRLAENAIVPFSSSLSLPGPPGALSALDILGFEFSLVPGEGCFAVFGLSCFPLRSFLRLCPSGCFLISTLSCSFLL